VETALDGLGEELKEIVILKAFEGMTFEEVAALKGKTPDAVRMAYSRAVVKVNASLNGTHASSNGRD
jgi:DNA-directed RNA polymerase specialized sigma24 family protein